MKENAKLKRKEKFDPTNEMSMTDKIAARKKKEEEEDTAQISTVVPLTTTTRSAHRLRWFVAAKSLDELRKRLQDKIAYLKQQRTEKSNKKDKRDKKGKQEKRKRENQKGSLPDSEEKRVKLEQPAEDEVNQTEGVDDEKQSEEGKKHIIAHTPSVNDVISK